MTGSFFLSATHILQLTNRTWIDHRLECVLPVAQDEFHNGTKAHDCEQKYKEKPFSRNGFVVKMELDTRPQRTVEIVDVSSSDRVVTAIEVLSPSNKIGYDNRLAYKRKRTAYVDSRVNLVEIDLIRDGDHIVAIDLDRVPKQFWGDYITCIQRETAWSQFELYPMPLRQPLPDISIPLRRTDKDVLLQIQVVIDQCYQDGRYWRTDYSQALRPRLSELDTVWADALIANVSQGPT